MKENLSKNTKYFDNDVWEKVNKSNKSMMDYYLKNKRTLKQSSVRQYENAIRIFLMWLYINSENECLAHVKKRKVLEYQNWLIEQGLTYNSIKFKRCALSSLYDFISEYYSDEYPEMKNIINDVPIPRVEYVKEKKYLTEKELLILREELTNQFKFKQLAFVEITFFTGLKKDELLSLNKNIIDIHYNNDGLYPVMVNNRKVYFNEESMQAVRYLLDSRGEDDNDLLFVSNKKGQVESLNPTVFNYWCSNNISSILGREIKPNYMCKKTKN